MSSWYLLSKELSMWQRNNQSACLWWRDDDAFEATPAFSRLLELSADTGVPLAVAVIPCKLSTDLGVISHRANVAILQHGCKHRNRADPGAKKCEMLSKPEIEDCLQRGKQWLSTVFGTSFIPVLAPPWNRIADDLIPRLPLLGFSGLSLFGSCPTDQAIPFINTHIDIIDWKGTRGFAGESKSLATLVEALQQRRTGQIDRNTPIGLLTHHLDHDEACWAFLEVLLSRTREHPAVQWCPVDRLLPSGTG